MPPSDAGVGAAGAGAPAAGPTSRSGPTRATPVLLLAVAGALLVARVALGIYEHARPVGRPAPLEGATRDSTFGAPGRGR